MQKYAKHCVGANMRCAASSQKVLWYKNIESKCRRKFYFKIVYEMKDF